MDNLFWNIKCWDAVFWLDETVRASLDIAWRPRKQRLLIPLKKLSSSLSGLPDRSYGSKRAVLLADLRAVDWALWLMLAG